jgi:hypothetical protein
MYTKKPMLKLKFSAQFKWLVIVFTLLLTTIVVLSLRLIQNRDQKIKNFEKLTEVLDEQDRTLGWTTYTDEELGFSFKHPDLDDECCTMGGPASEEVLLGKTYTDEDTLDPEITDKPFAGIAIYVIETDKTFDQYIADEKEALLLQEKDYLLYMSENEEGFDQKFVDDGVEKEIALNDQVGVILIHYSWDDIDRYYIPFPNSKKVLVIGKSSSESTKFTFDEIFSTFKFLGAQE